MESMIWILLVYKLSAQPYTMSLEYKQEFPNREVCIKEISKYQHKDKMVFCALKRNEIKD